jgi:putative FmdB family regulatory protein
MPIYEFYCPDCNTVFSFFSSAVRTDAAPSCPSCGRAALGRRPSRFAALSTAKSKSSGDDPDGDAELDGGDTLAGVDERRLEGALEALAGEMDSLSDDAEDDPRQMARFFRRFGELAGLEAGPKMEDMIRRLEAGEDPESFEDEFGGSGDPDDSEQDGGGLEDFFLAKKKLLAARRKPKVDDTLYFFD